MKTKVINKDIMLKKGKKSINATNQITLTLETPTAKLMNSNKEVLTKKGSIEKIGYRVNTNMWEVGNSNAMGIAELKRQGYMVITNKKEKIITRGN